MQTRPSAAPVSILHGKADGNDTTMNTMLHPLLRNILLLGFALWSATFTQVAGALPGNNTPMPSQQQIDQFKRLSPEQQRALAEQYGINLDELIQSSSANQPQLQESNLPNARPTVNDNSMFDRQRQGTNEDQTGADTQKAEEGLRQFGYDLFAGVPEAFTPAADIPPPDSYVLGPGDNLVIQLYGKENASYNLTINRDGQIQFPEIGPINLAGLSFNQARTQLMETVQEQMIGVKASVTMGTLRSIRIFVLGEALQPGSYTVSSLSTMTNALFASGGISKIGSLRNIQLKRQGKLITTLDLYDLLLQGDTSKDARLLPGDVIFIPPIGATVGVDGEVKRPAIYELKNERQAMDVIKLAGGYTPTAFPPASKIERINQQGDRTLVDLNLSQTEGKNTTVRNADTIRVYSVLDSKEGVVTLKGHVERPGDFAWKPGMRVSDLIGGMDALLPLPDVNIALIERERLPTREKYAVTFDLGEALREPGGSENLALRPHDTIYVFNYKTPRNEQLSELVNRLKLQASKSMRQQTITVSGYVRFPGKYPLGPKMTAQDAVALAGGLSENAYGLHGEITRVSYDKKEEQNIQHLTVNLANARTQDIQAEDELRIKRLPNWLDQEIITLKGEVKFPGEYKIKRGETLAQVIERAGGLNEWAYPEGAVFTREELRKLEEQRIQELRQRLESEIAASNVEQQSPDQEVAMDDAEALLENLNQVKPLGRMVIDLPAVIEKKYSIELRNGDSLTVPRTKQAITVVGEVQFPTSHIYETKLNTEQYIERSGGLTRKADDERIYVVKANGRVFLPQKSGWFSGREYQIEPGDTVVVPIDADRIKPLTLWTNISQVFYQIALGAAAIASF